MTLLVRNCPPATESPSNNRNALPIDRESLIFVGFARIGRVELFWEGSFVWGGCWLACILAGCVCLPDVITLWQQSDPPGAKSPSSNRITLQ